jgi:S1-C subfamily serine protease
MMLEHSWHPFEPYRNIPDAESSDIEIRSSPRRFARAYLGAFAIASCSACASDAAPSVVRLVRIEASGCGPTTLLASGYRAGSGRIVTVAHSLRGVTSVTVGGAVATVVSLDHRRDLAVLIVDGREHAPSYATAALGPALLARVDTDGVNHRDTVTVKGVGPLDMEEPRDKTSYRRDGLSAVLETGTVANGDSGSPIVDTKGRVLGVVFATDRDIGNTAFAVSAAEIESLLKESGTAAVSTGLCDA